MAANSPQQEYNILTNKNMYIYVLKMKILVRTVVMHAEPISGSAPEQNEVDY
jgi:hypothetical protein